MELRAHCSSRRSRPPRKRTHSSDHTYAPRPGTLRSHPLDVAVRGRTHAHELSLGECAGRPHTVVVDMPRSRTLLALLLRRPFGRHCRREGASDVCGSSSGRSMKIFGARSPDLRLALDVDPPTRQLRGQARVLAFANDGERELVIGHDHERRLRRLLDLDAHDLSRRQRGRGKRRYVWDSRDMSIFSPRSSSTMPGRASPWAPRSADRIDVAVGKDTAILLRVPASRRDRLI